MAKNYEKITVDGVEIGSLTLEQTTTMLETALKTATKALEGDARVSYETMYGNTLRYLRRLEACIEAMDEAYNDCEVEEDDDVDPKPQTPPASGPARMLKFQPSTDKDKNHDL